MIRKLLYPLCLLMAIVIIAVSIPTISYSWFEPDVKEGIGLEFKEETKLRAQECSIKTYEGTMGNKVVNYGNNEIASGNVTISATTSGDTTTPAFKYYKTVITNSSADYDTVVSLFISSFAPATNSNASLCVAYPTNSCRTYSAAQTDLHIIRNAYVPKNISTDANPGQLVVEWFVKCNVGSVTFNPSKVYLMYS